MENRQKIIQLFDIYEKLLTDKQKEYFTSYYFDDLSTGEIAANFNISRNAVHDHIKKTCNLLEYYEDNLQIHMKNEILIKLLESNDLQDIKEKIRKILEE